MSPSSARARETPGASHTEGPAALHEADVVIHDRLVAPTILELARREARLVSVGKGGFGPSTPQAEDQPASSVESNAPGGRRWCC